MPCHSEIGALRRVLIKHAREAFGSQRTIDAQWRGLGFISQSALKIRDEYAAWDAEQRFPIPGTRVTDPKAAQCGEVLKGVLKPAQCKLFGKECTPERPVGALMVSTEGSCAAYYNYEHRKAAALVTSISSVA